MVIDPSPQLNFSHFFPRKPVAIDCAISKRLIAIRKVGENNKYIYGNQTEP